MGQVIFFESVKYLQIDLKSNICLHGNSHGVLFSFSNDSKHIEHSVAISKSSSSINKQLFFMCNFISSILN